MTTRSSPFVNEGGPLIYLIGTPIGNLADISRRAIELLQKADIIASEDTRNTSRLLSSLGLKGKRLVPCYAQNERIAAVRLIEEVQREKLVMCYLSDAGNPGISDPGSILVSVALEYNVPVSAVLGPSALIHALIVSGFDTSDFSFYGFLPVKENARRLQLSKISNRTETLIFYESPHRLLKTLRSMADIFGPFRRVALCRELTKVHEEYIRGELREVVADMPESSVRGEFVIVVEGKEDTNEISEEDIIKAIKAARKNGLSVKEAVESVARDLKAKKNEVYRLATREFIRD